MVGGVELAEAYVLWKRHKEKIMKEAEKGRTNRSNGCFSWFPKRPTRVRDDNEKELIRVSANP
uniref:Uncharacterized protein n=1 Tax=Cajanus cajan TaxID=3821 RepID=A0A151RY65_CAJCA|nr:hypothetical protein KK1_030829 [Cajanus cajan]